MCVLRALNIKSTFLENSKYTIHDWDCVPVLLVVWLEASNTGVCRLLRRLGLGAEMRNSVRPHSDEYSLGSEVLCSSSGSDSELPLQELWPIPLIKKKKKKMRQEKTMSQTKEQGKNLQDQINEEEIGNLPEKEFRVMIVKMIQNLGNRMEARTEKIQEMFNKDLEELKNKQTEMTNTITEMKITLEGINNRISEAKELIQ